MELVLLAVLLVVVLGGVAFVVTRRKGETYELEPPSAPAEAPPAPAEVTEVLDEAAPPLEEAPPVVEEEPPAVKPRFRDRLGKARGAVSGYLGSVLSRDKV